MAARDLNERSFSIRCAICLDQLHVPKALPCLHTFCLQCLQRHINVTVKVREDKIACPECRTKCTPPDPAKPVSEWAGDFPLNFHLQNLIEATVSVQGGRSKDTSEADEGFARRLKDARTFVDNRLLELATDAKHMAVARSDISAVWKQSKEVAIEIFASLVTAVKAREEKLLAKLDADYVECAQRLYDTEEQIGVKMDYLRRCSALITDVMTGKSQPEGGDHGLDEVERRLREAQQDDIITTDSDLLIHESLVIEQEDVARTVRNSEDLGAFTTAPMMIKEQITHLRHKPAALEGPGHDATKIHTASDDDISINPTIASFTPRGGQPPVYLAKIPLRSAGDRKEPFVTGVCSLSGVLVLTDVNNRSVKGMVIHRQGLRASRLHDLVLRSDPMCVTAVASGQAVVGSECCFYVLNVDQKARLSVKQTIRLRKCYYGIAALPDGERVAACSDQPPSVDIINLATGLIVRTVSKDLAGRAIFTSPFYLTAMPHGHLLVSDKDNTAHPLTCISRGLYCTGTEHPASPARTLLMIHLIPNSSWYGR